MKPDPKQHIYEKYNFTCQYCGWSGATSFEQWLRGSLTIDHVVPRKHGGCEEESNLVVACGVCNRLKGQEKCSSVEEGRKIISEKKSQAEAWFRHFVLQVE